MKPTRGVLLTTALSLALALQPAHAAPQQPPSAPDAPRPTPAPLAWQIEVTFRAHAHLPAAAQVHVGPLQTSPFPGYDLVQITISAPPQAFNPIPFLVSSDRTRLIEYRDLSLDPNPRASVSQEARPARGGPSTAPVLIVNFDDLECPFCAELNQALPAILTRYKDQVRIVYHDYPSDEHPWAMHAAIDANCLAAQSPDAYWQSVDRIHSQSHLIDVPGNTVRNASHTVDSLVRAIAEDNHLNLSPLNACIEQQKPGEIEASIHEGETLHVGATPTLFINGAKLEGAAPLPVIFQMIDAALLAQGQTPPQ